MKRKLGSLAVDDLVKLFTEIALQQYPALMGNDVRTYNKLYPQMVAVREELKLRPGDGRYALIVLYEHPNLQVRLAAAKATLAIDYDKARRVIENIANSGKFPIAGDAGMTIANLDHGIFKPT